MASMGDADGGPTTKNARCRSRLSSEDPCRAINVTRLGAIALEIWLH